MPAEHGLAASLIECEGGWSADSRAEEINLAARANLEWESRTPKSIIPLHGPGRFKNPGRFKLRSAETR